MCTIKLEEKRFDKTKDVHVIFAKKNTTTTNYLTRQRLINCSGCHQRKGNQYVMKLVTYVKGQLCQINIVNIKST
jgi:hypothetical protein